MRKPKPLRVALVITALAVVAALVISFSRRAPSTEPLDSLAAFVASHGKLEPLAPAAGRFFGIPGESIVFTTCSVVGESGRMRSIGVRPRPNSDYLDILLVEVGAGGDAANYYLTSRAGKLIKAAHLDTTLSPITAASTAFDNELGFWQTWQREAVKHETQ